MFGGSAGFFGTIEFELGDGQSPGVLAGHPEMTGTVTLDGGLGMTVPSGQDPPAGTSFDVVTAGLIEGGFDCVDVATLGDGIMAVNIRTDRVTVTVDPGCATATDIDRDGVTDFGDLLLVLSAWGVCPSPCCVADIDDDADVDFGDLLVVLSGWGPCQ